LNVSCNNLSLEQDWKSCSQFLQTNKSIKMLRLNDCYIGKAQLQAIADGLQKN